MRALLLAFALLSACSDKGGVTDHQPNLGGDSAPEVDDSVAVGDDSEPPSADCGDGELQTGEACDEGDNNGASACGCQVGCQYAPSTSSCDDGDLCSSGDSCDGAGACAGEVVTCDDGDACTTDSCDPSSGACSNAGFSGSALDLYDMAALTDPSTLDLEVIQTGTTLEGFTLVEWQEIRYTSYQSEACTISPVRIEAYVSWPSLASSPLPGVVVAHGLGGLAEVGSATSPAGELGVVALAYSGPGQGQSEGTGSGPDHLFDTLDSPRDSWFWEHSVAAIRGLTVLEQMAEVDTGRMGMTGYSGGAVATYMVNGVDSRLDIAVPVSACGYLDSAARATPNPGWEADLLDAMTPPRTPDSPEWTAYTLYLDPKNFLPTAHGATLIIDGAQDQFFPIDSAVDTFTDLSATGGYHRLLSIKDWDHGWYALFTGEEAAEKTLNALQFWVEQGFGLDSGLSETLPMPQVDALVPWTCFYDGWYPYSCAAVQASLSTSTGYRVNSVKFHFSADNAYTFHTWNLQQNGSVWQAEIGTLDGAVYSSSNLVYFVEFELQDGVLGNTINLTSKANIPPGFSPYIIPIAGPLP